MSEKTAHPSEVFPLGHGQKFPEKYAKDASIERLYDHQVQRSITYTENRRLRNSLVRLRIYRDVPEETSLCSKVTRLLIGTGDALTNKARRLEKECNRSNDR